jgi:hypothetical protein
LLRVSPGLGKTLLAKAGEFADAVVNSHVSEEISFTESHTRYLDEGASSMTSQRTRKAFICPLSPPEIGMHEEMTCSVVPNVPSTTFLTETLVLPINPTTCSLKPKITSA